MEDHSDSHQPAPLTTHGLHAVTDYLDGERIPYKVIEHPATETAATEARAAHVPPDRMAKTLVARDGATWVIAVLPASRRLDLDKLQGVLECHQRPRLATEDEIRSRFPQVDVGAVPPVGPMLVGATILDAELLEQRHVVCPGGDHRHALRLDPRDIVRHTDAWTADITQDWASGEPRFHF